MQRVQRVEGLLDKRKEGQGPLGKTALPSSSLRWETGEGCSGRRRPWSSAAASGRGKRSRAAPGTDSQPQLGQGRSRVTWPRRPSANGRRRPWAGVPEARRRAIGRGKTSRGSGNPFSPLTSVRDGSGMAPHGVGRSFGDNGGGGGAGSFREKLGGGGDGGEQRWGAFYRRAMPVEEKGALVAAGERHKASLMAAWAARRDGTRRAGRRWRCAGVYDGRTAW